MNVPDFKDEETAEVLAKAYLPAALRDHWIVIPTRLLQWVSANVMLVGAAIGSLLTAIVAEFVPVDHLSWGFPILLGLAYTLAKFVLTPIDDKAIAEARKTLAQTGNDA